MTTTSALPSVSTMVFSTSSTTSKVFSSGTTENTKMLNTSKKPKMPRVTLKLRENETIPQMYVKAGIASYKKGNIATSVLASGLSLEGLIFKTPEGTIKPWPQKWFLGPSDPDVKTWKVFVSALVFFDRALIRSRRIAFKGIWNVLHFDGVHRSLELPMQKLLTRHFLARFAFSSFRKYFLKYLLI